jgi:phosphohistidine phosphatase
MTTIYLVRHGIAGQFGDFENDRDRPLTPEGQGKTHRIARHLNTLNIKTELILTSPYQRAHQTAQILLKEGLSDHLETADFLEPDSNFDPLHQWLTHWPGKSLIIVGHEPNLTNTAAHLIHGTPNNNIQLKKAGIIGLETPSKGEILGRSTLFWLTPPRLLL